MRFSLPVFCAAVVVFVLGVRLWRVVIDTMSKVTEWRALDARGCCSTTDVGGAAVCRCANPRITPDVVALQSHAAGRPGNDHRNVIHSRHGGRLFP